MGSKTQLQQPLKIVDLKLAVAKDSVQQSGADRLARMHRRHSGPPVLMTEEVVAALDPDDGEASLGERCEQVRARNTRNPAHAATVMRWIPTNSKVCSGAPATSRHNSTASRMRCVTSSKDLACVWHPGSCGTEAT